MKRLSIIAAIVTLVCCLCMSVSAATENTLTVSVNAPESVAPGEEIELKVDFSENTGFNTLGVKLTYPEGFTYVADSATVSTLIGDEFYLSFGGYEGETYVFYHNDTERTLTFVGASLYDVDEASGSLFSAKFVAPASITSETQCTFGIEMVDESYNEDGYTITETLTDGTVAVKPEEPDVLVGDINGDRKINSRDALRILRYRLDSTKNPLTAEQMIAADMRADGVINERDALAILKYELANK